MPDETDLGPMPEPEIEPREPNPGGADALPESGEALPADLSTAANPAVDEDAAPDEIQEGEDTSTEATDASVEEAGRKDTGSSEEGNA
ncbi:hypothetical protein [Nocardioides dongkuii]|uniref:hypothetical protein n=1 Tax=Nocardioides dongkuii TaxID=2760089 RepID=UPI0015F78F95|nr:hypothetical protein [Nocardioides dongkuii]